MKEIKICSYCGKQIGYRNLGRHERNIHKIYSRRRVPKKEEEAIQCHHCNKKFIHKKNLLAHLRGVHHFEIPKYGSINSRCSYPKVENVDADSLLKKLKLPESYTYSAKNIHTRKSWKTVISFDINALDEGSKWIEEYKKKSFLQLTKVGGNRTKLATDRVLFRIRYKCVHNKNVKNSQVKLKHRLDTKCPFKMVIRIIRAKEVDNEKKYRCQVTFLNFCHNHEMLYGDCINSPCPEMKEKFLQLFNDRNTPDKAFKKYSKELQAELKENFRWQKSYRALLPSREWVYHLYYSEYKRKCDSYQATTILEDLQKQIAKYNSIAGSTCIKLIKCKNDFAVVIVTEFMRRILHLIPQTCEIIFVDSSGMIEHFGCKVLLLMTNSCVGGLPVGVAITSSETEEMLSTIFDTFNSLLNEDSFYGYGSPAVIITDKCSAKQNSLHSSFPDAELVLCSFHILQACWRFVFNAKNSIKREDRHRCITHIKYMMYAKDESEYVKHLNSAINETYENFVSYVKKLNERKKEWVLFHQRYLLVHIQNIKNICEAGFRVLKEKILERLKTFCPQKLLDFIVIDFENYYKDKLTNIATGRSPPYLTLKMKDKAMFSIVKCDDGVYEVTNLKKNTTYIVYSNLGLCECSVGFNGRFCKHQYNVIKKYGVDFLSTLPQNEEGRLTLYKIANGYLQNIPKGFVGDIITVSFEKEELQDNGSVLTVVPTLLEPDSDQNSRSLASIPTEESVQNQTSDAASTAKPIGNDPFVSLLEETMALMEEDGNHNIKIQSSIINFCEKYKKLKQLEQRGQLWKHLEISLGGH